MNQESSCLTRRRFINTGLLAAGSLPLAWAARAALRYSTEAPVCQLIPEQEVGPFYVADELLRSDIVEGKPGVPLSLRILVLDQRTCKPLANAAVDLWHCDALGLYSGFTKMNFMGEGPGGPGGPGGPPPGGDQPPAFDPRNAANRQGTPDRMGGPPTMKPSDKLTFLRGIQLTAADGTVNFASVFPGFYMGRTNHIHFKVRVGGNSTPKTYGAGHISHVGQLFFPEDIATDLMKHEPYNQHNIHRTTQDEDHVFNEQNGDLMLATLKPLRAGQFAAGLHADLSIFVDPTATPAPVRMGGGFGGEPPRR